MKKHKKTILVGAAVLLVITIAMSVTFLGGGRAASAGMEASIQSDLQAQNLRVASVRQDASSDTLNVVLSSKAGGGDGDAWANAVVAREAGFLRNTGATTADWVDVTIVDEQGKTIYRWSGPVDSQLRPVGKAVDPTALDSLRPGLVSEAEKRGVTLEDLSILADASQGTVIEAQVVVSALAGDVRDNEIKWSTLELLGTLRDYAEGPGVLDVDLYKISIHGQDGSPLVEYVVDPAAKTVRAWMAPGVSPVWSTRGLSPRPAATSTAP